MNNLPQSRQSQFQNIRGIIFLSISIFLGLIASFCGSIGLIRLIIFIFWDSLEYIRYYHEATLKIPIFLFFLLLLLALASIIFWLKLGYTVGRYKGVGFLFPGYTVSLIISAVISYINFLLCSIPFLEIHYEFCKKILDSYSWKLSSLTLGMGSFFALGIMCGFLVKDYIKAGFRPKYAVKVFVVQSVLMLLCWVLIFLTLFLYPKPNQLLTLLSIILIAVGISLWLRLRSLKREKLISGRSTAKSRLYAWRKHLFKVGIAIIILYNFKYPYALLTSFGFQPQSLKEAIESGDINAVKDYLDKGVNPNATNIFYAWRTPLHHAIGANKKNIVELLLAKGADISIIDDFGETPLKFAIRLAGKDIVELLITKGNISPTDEYTLQEVPDTVERKRKQIVEQQLAKGTNVNHKDRWGNTLLQYATSKDIAQRLIAKGADVNAKGYADRTPLHIAVLYNNKEVIEVLLANGADVNAKDRDNQTPLTMAFRSSRAVQEDLKDMVELLIAKGANVNAKNNSNETPLFLAMDLDREDIAKLLVTHGADVNLKGRQNLSPLHIVGSKEMAELLITHGADVNAKADNGETPLHTGVNCFSDKCGIEVAILLIAKGADVNAKSKNGQTPLHKFYYNKEVVELLIAKGADVHAKDNQDKTVLDIALKSGGYKDTVESLITKGKNISLKGKYAQNQMLWNLLYEAVLNNQKNMVELLIAKGFDVNAKGLYDRTPLYWAKSKEMAQLLIAKGASINVKDNQGLTPLDWAAANGRRDIVELLKSYGAKHGN